jgi:TonB family protein
MADVDTEQRPSRRLWFFAGIVALALHLGGAALALTHLKIDEPEDDLGASAIEVGVEMMVQRTEAADLPPGPESDASVASPAVAEQKAELKDTDLPKDTPSESEDPDRIVTANETRKPVEETVKQPAIPTSASRASVTAEAAAPPSSELMPQGPRSVAPSPGTGEAARRMRATWEKQLVAHLDRHKRYPADRAAKSTEIVVGFVLDRLGHVLSSHVVKGSGDPAFDNAALAMIKRSDPVPQPPPLVADEGLTFTVPVVFRVKGKG